VYIVPFHIQKWCVFVRFKDYESLHKLWIVDLLHNIFEPTTGVIFFNSGFKSDPTELFPSIELVIACEKRFPPPNFNLKIVRIQRGGGSWMLLDAVLHC
jgi:hypothetical protein